MCILLLCSLCPESRSSEWKTLRTCPWSWWGTSVTSRPGRWTPSRPRTWHAATASPSSRPRPRPDRWESAREYCPVRTQGQKLTGSWCFLPLKAMQLPSTLEWPGLLNVHVNFWIVLCICKVGPQFVFQSHWMLVCHANINNMVWPTLDKIVLEMIQNAPKSTRLGQKAPKKVNFLPWLAGYLLIYSWRYKYISHVFFLPFMSLNALCAFHGANWTFS